MGYIGIKHTRICHIPLSIKVFEVWVGDGEGEARFSKSFSPSLVKSDFLKIFPQKR